MVQITPPKVNVLASGTNLIAKQMQASAGDLLPEHLADSESILFIHEGECIMKINNEEKPLKQGDAFVVPPDTRHQIQAKTDFKGIHIMPENITFEFFK